MADIRSRLLAQPGVGAVDVFDGYVAVPALDELLRHDAVIVVVNSPMADRAGMGDLLADYVDAGGGVVLTLASFISGWELGGRFRAGPYSPFQLGTGPIGSSRLGSFDAAHPIMSGVGDVGGELLGAVTLEPDARLVASWLNGQPCVATRGDRVAAINLFVGETGLWSGDAPRLLRNAAGWVGRATNWLAVGESHGVVAGGGRKELTVRFDAARLRGGAYDATIVVDADDPSLPQAAVAAHLAVTAAPDVAWSPPALEFGSVFLGSSRRLGLHLANRGAATLHVTGLFATDAAYSIETAPFELSPAADRQIGLQFAPAATGAFEAELILLSDDPDSPELRVALYGIARDPPVAAVTPAELAATVFEGGAARRELHVANAGGSPLELSWRAFAGDRCAPELYLTEPTLGTVLRIDTASGAIETAASALTAPHAVAATGETLYVTESVSGELSAVDLTTGAVARIAQGLSYPAGIALAADGIHAYVVEPPSGNLLSVDLTTGTSSTVVAASLVDAFGLTLNSAATTAYLTRTSGSLVQVDLATGVMLPLAAELELPVGLALDPSETIAYVAEYLRGELVAVELASGAVTTVATGLHQPYGVVLGPAGNTVYVVEYGARDVVAVDPTSGAKTELVRGLAAPTGITLRARTRCPAAFVTTEPASASIAPLADQAFAVSLDGAGLAAGTYEAQLELASNDPLRPVLAVRTALTVLAAPNLRVSADLLEFGNVFLGQAAPRSLQLENTGSAPLTVSVLTDRAEFVPTATSFVLAPHASAELRVVFAPAAAGPSAALLALASDDPDRPLLELPLAGTGVEPPQLELAPPAFDVTLLGGQQRLETLVLANAGRGPLDLALHVAPSGSFLTVEPAAGSLAPGESLAVSVGFVAGELIGGRHDSSIEVTSNDPARPQVIVPAALTVIGVPRLELRGEPAIVESIADYATGGALTVHRLAVTRPPAGDGVLELIAEGNFGDAGETASATAEGRSVGGVGELGVDCIPARGNFTLGATELAALAEDGTVDVQVRNAASVAPSCPINQHVVRLHYAPRVDGLSFGEQAVGQRVGRTLELTNSGNAALHVSVTSARPEFAASAATLELAPGRSAALTVTFAPAAPGPVTAALVLESDDPQAPRIDLPLGGSGVAPPVVETSPGGFEPAVLQGKRRTETLLLTNRGGSPLEFSLRARAASRTGLPAPAFELRQASPAPLTCLVADPATGDVYAQAHLGTAFYRYEAAADTWRALASAPLAAGNDGGAALLHGRIYTSYADYGTLGVYTLATNSWSLLSSPLGHTANVTSDGARFLYLARDTTLVRFDPLTLRAETLAAAPLSFSPWGGLGYLDGMLYADQGRGATAFARYDVAAGTWTVLPPLPAGAVTGAALDPFGREYLAYGSYGESNLYRFSVDAGTWSVAAIPYFPVNDGGLAWLPGAVYVAQGENGRGFVRIATTPLFVAAEPAAGVIGPGETLAMSLRFDSAGLGTGRFEARIELESNDPLQPRLVVPAALTVGGVPRFVLGGAPVTVESSASYVILNAVTVHDLLVTQAAAGGGTLELTVEGDYGNLFELATATAEGRLLGSVGVAGTDCIASRRSFGLTAPQLAALTADGALHVQVQNSTTVDARCSFNRHQLRLHYTAAADVLDFGEVLVGQTARRSLELHNAGGAPLVVAIASSGTGFSAAASRIEVAPADSVVLDVDLKPAGRGELHGTLLLSSNDPDAPQATVGLRGTGRLPPTLDVTPLSLHQTLLPGQAASGVLVVTNRGDAPLELAAARVGSLFFDDMEHGTEGWTTEVYAADDLWHRTEKDAQSPRSSWWCGVESRDDYATPHTISTALVSPRIDLTGAVPPITLQFVERYETEPVWDQCLVDVSVDDGASWIPLRGAYGEAPSGNSHGWVGSPIGLSSFAGRTLRVRFYFESGDEVNNGFPGWFVDDVRVLSASQGWLHVDPSAAAIPPGGSREIQVELDSAGLAAGHHASAFDLRSNDPARGVVTVPVTLDVLAPPEIAAPAALDLGELVVGARRTHPFVVSNVGAGPLELHAAADDAALSVEPATLTLPAQTSASLELSWEPRVAGPLAASVVLDSNDPDAPRVAIAVRGTAVAPPVAVLAPEALETALPPHGTVAKTRSVSLRNEGASTLRWSATAAGPLPLDWIAVRPRTGELPPRAAATLEITLVAASLDPGDWSSSVRVDSNDPLHPSVEISVLLHVGEVGLTVLDVDPRPKLDGTTIEAALQLPAACDPRDVIVGSVTLWGEIVAEPAPVATADRNADGIPELILQFDAIDFEKHAGQGEVAVVATGEVRDRTWFRGSDVLRVFAPRLAVPNGGEFLRIGAGTTIAWEPVGSGRRTHYDLLFSRDDGASWEPLAAGRVADTWTWSVAGPPTAAGRIRVLAWEGAELLGYDTSDAPFLVHHALPPPGPVPALRAAKSATELRLHWLPPPLGLAAGPAASYRVLQATAPGGPFREIGAPSATAFPLDPAPEAPLVYYRIVAVNAAGEGP
ncbi:MAG TPA: choice-of-anchor D domain-containing protein [Candidatus Polarisedimenticolaceae bacterium]|nr:choice-of-anchor D domain-containing protein [Candidatus Polarisedimenticolaceae bacterium]